MTDEYDLFGDLDALCNDNLLTKFKSSVPAANQKTSSDHSESEDDFLNIKMCKKTDGRKKDKTFADDALDASTSKRKGVSPSKRYVRAEKCSSPKSQGAFSVEDSEVVVESSSASGVGVPLVPPIVLPVGRRQTRSISKNMPFSTSTNPTVIATSRRGAGRGRRKRNNTSADLIQNLIALSEMAQNQTSSALTPLQQMLNRRDIAAAKAAMCTNVDYVDLVSSPVPRINGVINVDSDNDDLCSPETSTPIAKTSSLDLSFDKENPEISVKVIWNGNPEIFKLRRHQKLAHIYNIIATRENTEERNIVFNLNNKILSPDDTPASIDYKIYQFINGRVLVSMFDSPVAPIRKKRDANKIVLKIQSDKWKKPLQIELLRSENFKVLYIKCAEELSVPYDNFKLSFDGESLEFDDTPASLELEGGEAIDLRMRN